MTLKVLEHNSLGLCQNFSAINAPHAFMRNLMLPKLIEKQSVKFFTVTSIDHLVSYFLCSYVLPAFITFASLSSKITWPAADVFVTSQNNIVHF